MKPRFSSLLLSSCLFLGIPAVAQDDAGAAKAEQGRTTKQAKAASQLIAVMDPTAGNKVRGTVVFKPMGDGKVEVTARLTGLQPMSGHGFHVHQYGDVSGTDGSTAGGHFNPKGKPHGLPPKEKRHVGDLGNLIADRNGQVDRTFVVENLPLTGKHSILGRAVILHAEPDTGGQPSGDAGERIGFGVIGYRFQPEPNEG